MGIASHEPDGCDMPQEGESPTRFVSMADVAAAAGVSQQTVSRVVNDRPNVSEITRSACRRPWTDWGSGPITQGDRFVAAGTSPWDCARTTSRRWAT